MLKLVLLAGLLMSCGDLPPLVKCPADTRTYVCFHPGWATCENDNMQQVVGCYVQATETVQLVCVSGC